MSYLNGTQPQTVMRPHGHSEFYDLEQADEELQRRVNELEGDRDTLRRELSDLAETIEEHEGTGDEHADLIGELTERVTWLESVVANAGLVTVADFDTFTDEDKQLAELARLGREAEITILTPTQRAQHKSTIQRMTARAANYQTALEKTAAAAIVLGEIGPNDPQHGDVVAAYRTARRAQPAPVSDHERRQARSAKDQLAQDDIDRQEVAEVIEIGNAAAHELLTRARRRVAKAIGASHMMPRWFATNVGRTAPADNPDRWIATAAEVLVYRLTYEVTGDQIRALGPRPDPSRAPARYAFYTRLARSVSA